MLAKRGLEMSTLEDVGLTDVNPDEKGSTFSEVARNKFRDYASHIEDTDQIIFSEDGGISVDALNGEPGIKSRRWKDGVTDMSDEECIEYILDRMRDVPQGQRTARYHSAVAFGRKGEKPQVVLAEVRGIILVEPRMNFMSTGFPYRTLFFVVGEDQMLAELERREDYQSHLEKSIEKMVLQLQN